MEDILIENKDRFVLFPIKHDAIWEMYKRAQASFWIAEEIDLADDVHDFNNKLNDDERHFIQQVLAFFAASDGIVNENIAVNLLQAVQYPEARCFYGFQVMIENVHAEMYSLMIDTFVKDEVLKDKLFKATSNYPAVTAKAEWAMTFIENPKSFAQSLAAFAAVEGIFFSGSFCSIFWLKKRGLMRGLAHANELISRDEGMHTDFACLLYSRLENKLPESELADLLRSACTVEKYFVKDAIPVRLIGMNADLMCQYIEFVTDRLFMQLGGSKPLYGVKNPFDFMDMISLPGKTNFFERRVSEYAKAKAIASDIVFDDEF